MKQIRAVLLSTLLVQGCAITKPIQWLDHATVTEYGYKSHTWPSNIQFGLNNDGFVVWRKVNDK